MYCDDSTTHTGSERGSYDLYDIQIEAGSSATSYEPYTNTVYGGSIDLVSGVLTVTHKIVDLSQISWALRDTGLYRSGVISDMVAVSSNSERVDGYADHYPVASYTSLSSGEYGIGVNTQRRIFIGGGSEGAGSFVYPLATPQTHQLTPQEVRTIAGLNHIWADTGNAAVRYWRN